MQTSQQTPVPEVSQRESDGHIGKGELTHRGTPAQRAAAVRALREVVSLHRTREHQLP